MSRFRVTYATERWEFSGNGASVVQATAYARDAMLSYPERYPEELQELHEQVGRLVTGGATLDELEELVRAVRQLVPARGPAQEILEAVERIEAALPDVGKPWAEEVRDALADIRHALEAPSASRSAVGGPADV